MVKLVKLNKSFVAKDGQTINYEELNILTNVNGKEVKIPLYTHSQYKQLLKIAIANVETR